MNREIIILIALMCVVTIFTRFLPYFVFAKRETPAFILYLGKVLPYAIMGMLVIYCFKGVEFIGGHHAIPELISCAVVVLAQVLKRNMVLSIILGTACYMLLMNVIWI